MLFSAEVASGLIGHLIGALSGGSLYRKASFLTDSLGRKLLPETYSVIERPLLPRGPGSAAFDGDGVATFEKAFIDRGHGRLVRTRELFGATARDDDDRELRRCAQSCGSKVRGSRLPS